MSARGMAEVQPNFRFGNTTGAPQPETITLSRDNLALFTADDRNATSEEPALTSAWLGGQLRIPLYSVIFVLAVVGNSLVIVTLAQNRRMRTVTNVFLLNLSVSDLLLAVFCMPFTLIPTLLKDFIFGKVMCVFIRYLQGVSVGVSVLTLVAISLERYYAICHPLTSRRWQTRSHAYRIIAAVWVLALSVMIPTAVYQKLPKLRSGAHKCMEIWDDLTLEKAYTIFLDLVLLVVPLMLMLIAYGWITFTLWRGIQLEIRHAQEMTSLKRLSEAEYCTGPRLQNGICTTRSESVKSNCRSGRSQDKRYFMRHSNAEKNLVAKKRVIKMLFVVVFEFFVCWTPLYALQTWIVFDYAGAVTTVSPTAMSFIHLLSYVSSCCNPITYCFMNSTFRQGFLAAFRCCYRRRRAARFSSRRTDLTYVASLRSDATNAHPYPSVHYN